MQDDPIYIVSGMHRSGTSALAGLLSRCGFALGVEQELLQATAHNVKGHFEHMSSLQINDTLLALAGGSWGTLPSQEQIDAVSQQSADAIRNFCRSFAGNLIKDPRFSVTLPEAAILEHGFLQIKAEISVLIAGVFIPSPSSNA